MAASLSEIEGRWSMSSGCRIELEVEAPNTVGDRGAMAASLSAIEGAMVASLSEIEGRGSMSSVKRCRVEADASNADQVP
jgi:hypothetical protein